MKKIIFVMFLFLSAGCFAYITLLTPKDWLYLEHDKAHPAITFPDSNEEHYNEWSCHLTQYLGLELVPIRYDGKNFGSPTVVIRNNERIIEYALDPEPITFSELIMTKWEALMKNTEETCFVSAFLQTTPEGELRIIQRIKTKKGVWDWFEESENYEGSQRSDL